MSIPSSEQYAAMIRSALDGGYAYPAVNVTSSQTLNAALRGFADARSAGIVQVTTGGAKYLAGGGDRAAGGRAFAALAHELAADLPVHVALHTDHCPPEQVDEFLRPLLGASRERVARGEPPLFNSHMFDGSTLPLEENLRVAAGLLEECRELGIVLEVECGVVGGEEDGIGGAADAERLYTTTADLMRVVEVLGTEGYLLAATFGNVHGVYAPGHVKLRPEILRDGQEALAAARPGERFAYVFHGSSGTPDGELAEAVSYGVVKVNVDTEMQYAFTRALADHVLKRYDAVLRVDGGLGDKGAFDPRAWGAQAEEAMAGRVARECERLGSAGHAASARA